MGEEDEEKEEEAAVVEAGVNTSGQRRQRGVPCARPRLLPSRCQFGISKVYVCRCGVPVVALGQVSWTGEYPHDIIRVCK